MAKDLPPVPTSEQFEAFELGLDALQPPHVAASLAGISMKQLDMVVRMGRSGFEPYAEYTRAIDRVHASIAADVLTIIAEAARNGDTKAAQWLYEKKVAPAEAAWQKRMERLEQAEDEQSNVPDFSMPSEEDVEAAERRAMRK